MQISAKPDSQVVYASHLNHASWLGRVARGHLVLLDVVEAAAVDRPQLSGHARLRILGALRRLEMVVEEDEVERRADPCDGGDHVQPAHEQVGPLAKVVRVDRGEDHVHGAHYRRSVA